MFFEVALYLSLAIFGLGLVYRVHGWFSGRVGLPGPNISTRVRLWTALKGTLRAVFSPKILRLLKAFGLAVLLQVNLLGRPRGLYVWSMHLCLFGGFSLLLLMHGLESIISTALFENYLPTLNPFFFLRNLFGALVLTGLIMALIRRIWLRKKFPETAVTDHFGLIILAVIILSGFLLEGAKIASPGIYREMVEDYASLENQTQAQALEYYWTREEGLVSARTFPEDASQLLAQGRELSQAFCADCHAKAKWAFGGFAAAQLMSPLIPGLDRAGWINLLWHLHFLACFVGLAGLPFSRMFHLIVAPLSILTSEVFEPSRASPAGLANKLSLELDGCSHGGACHPGCPVKQKRGELIEENQAADPLLAYLKENLKVDPER